MDFGLKNKKIIIIIEKIAYKTNVNILNRKKILWINEDKGYSMNIKSV